MAVPLCQNSARVDTVREDVGLDVVGDGGPLLREALLALHLCQLGAAIESDPAHDLRRREVLRFTAHLPDPAVGLTPVLDRFLDLLLE